MTGPLITKKEAAQLAGVSPATFHRRMLEKVFNPVAIRETDRALMFEERSITTISHSRTTSTERIGTAAGAIAARVFELLDEKLNQADIVKELAIVPAVVKALAAEWAEMRGVILIYPKEAAELNGLTPTPGIKNADELLTLVRNAKKMIADSERAIGQAREFEHRLRQEQQSAPQQLKHIENMRKLDIDEKRVHTDQLRVQNAKMIADEAERTKRREIDKYRPATPGGFRSHE